MRLSVIQPDLVWESKSLNLNSIEQLLQPLHGKTDLVVLPEMFNTGFSMNTAELSETQNGDTFFWMSEISRKGNFAICGSYIVREDQKVYNRWVFVGPGEEYYFYNKRHAFSMGEEDKFITQGHSRLVFNYLGFRISPYICYDLRFPVWSRNRNDADLLIYAANWPETRKNVWDILLKARAIENQCFVAGSNRIGVDGNGIRYSGDSVIIDPKGEIIALADQGQVQSISTEIKLEDLIKFRNKFPVLKDADSFSIEI
ncbi:MAG TPA: amidohydrolase [Bacteroidales bacterium]|nr:amidohydrolase [Bacteroidales bacterium]